MANAKWITDLNPEMSVRKAAKTALSQRYDLLGTRLRTARESEASPEAIHQLRVATRRASAALSVFGDCVARKLRRRQKRLLRRFRQAAGAARDWDVFLEYLVAFETDCDELRAGLIGYALTERRAVQVGLEQTVRKLSPRWDVLAVEGHGAIKHPERESETFAERACVTIDPLIERLTNAVDSVEQDVEQLHAARLIGKKLRYSMELFTDCYREEFQLHLYPAVEELQQLLGAVNDASAFQEKIHEFRSGLERFQPLMATRWREGFELLLRRQCERIEQARADFGRWRETWHRLLGERSPRSLLLAVEYSD